MRKLFGSSKKGKRTLDKTDKGSYPVEDIDLDEYFIDDILMDENITYFADTEEPPAYAEEPPIYEEEPSTYAEVRPAYRTKTEEQQAEDTDTVYQPYYDDDPAEQTDNKATRGKRSKIKIRRVKRPLGKRHIIYAAMLLIGVAFAAVGLRFLLSDVIEDAAARSEYTQLRESFPEVAGQTQEIPEDEIPLEEGSEDYEETEQEQTLRDHSLDELAAINPDFIGWINANNSIIDYPVVRGSNNEKYINTTFFGTHNSAGTIFMDYRQTDGFDGDIVILYGHRTRDGSMFTTLVNHLDPEYRRRNPNISIITRDGRKLTYVIFAVKLTDAWDPAYTAAISGTDSTSGVFPNAPANATRFLLLSTCTAGNNDDERILVFAALH